MARSDAPLTEPAAEIESPAPEEIFGQLERILTSADLAQSDRIKGFLRFVVEESLKGRAERLKEYTIATEVFGRDESFDPQTNTIVRVQAGRLRRQLERYYLTEGRTDEIRISLPKGSYVPVFRRLQLVPELAPAPVAQVVPAPEVASLPEPAESAARLPTGPSIAVLPFENLSGDPGQDFFVDGITEEIINDLTRFPDLRVIARHSTFKYKGQRIDIRDVGRDLGVRFVLEGSVRKAEQMIRVTGQLIDAEDGAHLFSETYDRDLSGQSLFAIQDDIADRIVAAVGQPYGVLARSAVKRTHHKASQDLTAYDAVLRFYDYWMHHSSEGHHAVRAALEAAVKRDESYASAWAALAAVYLDELRFGFNLRSGSDPLERALTAAQRAVRLDPENSMAYHFLFSAHFHRGELDEFRATSERAVALNPNHADMLSDLGTMLVCIGEDERGMALANKAIALSPTHPGWFHTAAVIDFYRKGQYEAALAEALQLRMTGFFWNYLALAMCYGQLGRENEARTACDMLLEVAPDIATQIWPSLSFWNLPLELMQAVAEGLRKAGLQVPDPEL